MKLQIAVISILCIFLSADIKAQDCDPLLDENCEQEPNSINTQTGQNSAGDANTTDSNGNQQNIVKANDAINDPNKKPDGEDCTRNDQCASGFCGFTGKYRFQALIQIAGGPENIIVCRVGEAITNQDLLSESFTQGPCKAYFDATIDRANTYFHAQTHCPLYQCRKPKGDKNFLLDPHNAGACYDGWNPNPRDYSTD